MITGHLNSSTHVPVPLCALPLLCTGILTASVSHTEQATMVHTQSTLLSSTNTNHVLSCVAFLELFTFFCPLDSVRVCVCVCVLYQIKMCYFCLLVWISCTSSPCQFNLFPLIVKMSFPVLASRAGSCFKPVWLVYAMLLGLTSILHYGLILKKVGDLLPTHRCFKTLKQIFCSAIFASI